MTKKASLHPARSKAGNCVELARVRSPPIVTERGIPMANILLTDDEYQTVVSMHTESLDKIATASPRLAALYRKANKLYADFLTKEDARRHLREKGIERRVAVEQKSAERRVAALQATQQRIQQRSQQATTAPNTAQQTGRKTA